MKRIVDWLRLQCTLGLGVPVPLLQTPSTATVCGLRALTGSLPGMLGTVGILERDRLRCSLDIQVCTVAGTLAQLDDEHGHWMSRGTHNHFLWCLSLCCLQHTVQRIGVVYSAINVVTSPTHCPWAAHTLPLGDLSYISFREPWDSETIK